ILFFVFFFSRRRRHTRFSRDWSSDVCSSDLTTANIPSIKTAFHQISILKNFHSPINFHFLQVGDNPFVQFRFFLQLCFKLGFQRSEERRVGKEGGNSSVRVL